MDKRIVKIYRYVAFTLHTIEVLMAIFFIMLFFSALPEEGTPGTYPPFLGIFIVISSLCLPYIILWPVITDSDYLNKISNEVYYNHDIDWELRHNKDYYQYVLDKATIPIALYKLGTFVFLILIHLAFFKETSFLSYWHIVLLIIGILIFIAAITYGVICFRRSVRK